MREAGKKDPAITCFRTLRHYHRLWKLNGRVRNGNECDLPDMVTGIRQQYGEALLPLYTNGGNKRVAL